MNMDSISGLPKRSAANIRIIKKELPDYISGLRAMLEGLGSGVNKHDRADVLIMACISDGVVSGSDIIALANQLGFKHGHVAIRLHEGAGRNPDVYLWDRDDDGNYRLHNKS